MADLHVLALAVDLHLPDCRSLKAKRAVLRPVLDGIRRRFAASVAEVADHDKWQRARLGVAVVSGTESQAREVLDEVERFVWSRPDVQVLEVERGWVEL